MPTDEEKKKTKNEFATKVFYLKMRTLACLQHIHLKQVPEETTKGERCHRSLKNSAWRPLRCSKANPCRWLTEATEWVTHFSVQTLILNSSQSHSIMKRRKEETFLKSHLKVTLSTWIPHWFNPVHLKYLSTYELPGEILLKCKFTRCVTQPEILHF